MSTPWNEYTDESDEESLVSNVNSKQTLIDEATRLLFLRKYANTGLSQSELIQIFDECNYEDEKILHKIENKLKISNYSYIIIDNPFENTHRQKNCKPYINNHKKKQNNSNYSYRNNSKYYKSYNKKKGRYNKYFHHEIFENEVDYINLEEKKDLEEYTERASSNSLERKVSSFSISSNENTCNTSTSEVLKERSKEKMLSSIIYPYHRSANYILKDLSFLNSESQKKFPSKLFSGVFFDFPIQESEADYWKRVIDYYTPSENNLKKEEDY